ncbi:FUSC family protein [Alicyclobacillus fodiniaquatilis]|uniref:FUSC family protein n=1 Tax=Alicyclobacillus fodiniaquatilis TaxID=1661150 RepID=A0ABW4JPA2_9BACL
MKQFAWRCVWLADMWDRILASDPGLTRLHTALAVAVAVASTLGVEYEVASATHAGPSGIVIAMLLGAVVAMMGTMSLSGTGVWAKVRNAAFFPVAVGIGMLAGGAMDGHTDLMLAVFVVVMFAAVIVRRFGVPYFFYGFMGWMGYFFAAFTNATLEMVPRLLVSVIVASAWVLLLSITVLRTNPTRALRQTVLAFGANARAMAWVCAEFLRASDTRRRERLCRRLHAQQVRLAEAALMVEAWSAEPGALPPNQSAPALRRRLIDAEHVLDQLAAYAEMLAQRDTVVTSAAALVAERLAHRDDAGARQAAHDLMKTVEQVCPMSTEDGRRGLSAARLFAEAALEFIRLAQAAFTSVQTGIVMDEALIDEFQPVVGLALGNLPGSPAVAKDVPARGARWNLFARLDLTTRQAIQVVVAGGLAIVFGRALSPTRYYWAVIAAFVMFTGTATRTETFLKGVYRVLGTFVGLIASIGLAELTAGHTAWVLIVVVASIFCGFYLVRVSYAYMIFFITIMIGQLYSVLHEFSAGLLVLRLEETSIGAVIGFVVALAVVPLSTRDTVRVARNNFLNAFRELLDTAAKRLTNADGEPDLDTLTRTLDNQFRQLALVTKPLARPLIWGYSPRVRHRLALYASITTGARALAVALRQPYPSATSKLASACQMLALNATRLSEPDAVKQKNVSITPDTDVEHILFADAAYTTGDCSAEPVVRRLFHLEQLLRELNANPSDPL